jgi:Zn-dependent peptidase ImmA (M78 family)
MRIGGRVWGHPSVLALIREHGHQADPVAIIRERARALIDHGRKLGWDGPPFDPRMLASCLGIKVRSDQLKPGHDAFIFPVKERQLQIVFNAERPVTRQNFSIFHEIIHTVFPDGYEMVRHRHDRREKFDPDREIEFLCDVGAAELLLPADPFLDDLGTLGFSLDAVLPLRERYSASREAIIRRMVQLDRGVSAAVFLEYRLKPTEIALERQLRLVEPASRPQAKLRIAYAVMSERFRVFLPRHKSIPDDSCAYGALGSGTVEKGQENWAIAKLPMCHVEAMSMPVGDSSDVSLKAVAIVRPQSS